MRLTAVPMLALFALAACGERANAPAAPVEKAAAAPVAQAAAPAPVVLSTADLRRVCVTAMVSIHGQTVDAAGFEGQTANAIRVERNDGGVVAVSWPAPVDGGRRSGECRVEGDRVFWRPTHLPSGQESSWMTGPEDPVVSYTIDDREVVITQTFPEGGKSQTSAFLPSEEEAR